MIVFLAVDSSTTNTVSTAGVRTGGWAFCSVTCGVGIRRRLVRCGQKVCRTPRPPDTESCDRGPCPSDTPHVDTPTCVQDGSFFCHGNTNYCHVKGYRELCCKTCEGYTENERALAERPTRLRSFEDFANEVDYDEDDANDMLDYGKVAKNFGNLETILKMEIETMKSHSNFRNLSYDQLDLDSISDLDLDPLDLSYD